MFIVQASNVHIAGGAVLLSNLVDSLCKLGVDAELYVDERFQYEGKLNSKISLLQVKATILGRFKTEYTFWRKAIQNPSAKVLFFGNLPPLFRTNKNAFLYFQNVILLDEYSKFEFSFKVKVKHIVERLWLQFGIKHINTVFVQSESVRRKFLAQFPESNVSVVAFASPTEILNISEKKYDFIYIAAAEPHKNHARLIRAWIILFQIDIKPKLMLTAQLSGEAGKLLEEALGLGVRIEIKKWLSHKDSLRLYGEASALIFPSLAESFGLPLLEAKSAGLPIIASELDYVRDLVVPIESFEPNSELSIARAVQRFMHKPEFGKTIVKSPEDFVKELLLR